MIYRIEYQKRNWEYRNGSRYVCWQATCHIKWYFALFLLRTQEETMGHLKSVRMRNANGYVLVLPH